MFYRVETVLDRLVGRSRFLFVLGLLGGLVGGLSACDADLCETQLLDEVTSPDGTYQAEISERDCGATGASTMLTVHALRETEDGWEQLNIPLSNSQSSAASGEWQSETELVVAIGGGSGGGRRVIDLKQVWADRLAYETGATFPSIEPAFDLTGVVDIAYRARGFGWPTW